MFSTLDIIAAPGYSTTPFDVIAGIDLDGRITGAKVVFHNEPFIVHDPVRQRLLDTLLAREAGRPLARRAPTCCRRTMSPAPPSARAPCAPPCSPPRGWSCARGSRAAPSRDERRPLDVDSFSTKSVDELIAEGAVAGGA